MRLIACLIYFFITSTAASPLIIQKPITFNKERIELTREYRKQHYGINKKSIEIGPQMIVLHWTTLNSLQASFDLMNPVTVQNRPDISGVSSLNVSAQFLVDRDGAIYQLMPSNWMGRHVIGLNNIAIGIENVGGVNGQPDLTKAQVKANIALIRQLVKQYPTIYYLIGHFEYLQFKNSPLWEEKNPNYSTTKSDPGQLFMSQVRGHVSDLKLKDHPSD